MPGQPRLRMLDDVHASAFDSSPARLGLRMLGEIIVEIEASIEAGSQCFAVKDYRANERCGVIRLFLQQLGQGWMQGESGTAKSVTPWNRPYPVRMLA